MMSGNWLLEELESAAADLEQLPTWARPTLSLSASGQETSGSTDARPSLR